MTPTRRDFVHDTLRAGAGLSLAGLGGAFAPSGAAGSEPAPARHPLRILILGGTSFIGPHQIAYAMSRGHTVSTFTRGQREPTVHRELFGDVEALIGDREDDLEALRGRTWDAVIDNSGQRVEWTRDSANLLRDSVDLYAYTSSTGVYYPYLHEGIAEESEVALRVPDGIEGDGAYDYGVMKANSEIAARRAFGDDRTIVVRPGYMMGPADSSNRFIYWPVRLARGGEVMVPGNADDPVQYIDARDVAEWTIRLIENRTAGTFNAVGPASPTGMRRFVHGAHASFDSNASFVEIPDYEFLREHRIGAIVPWIMPAGNNWGSARISLDRAIGHGLMLRPLADSMRDMWAWWNSDAVSEERRQGLVSGPRSLMAREASVLEAWRAR